MEERIVLLGCSGHAKSVADIIEATGEYKIIGFVDKEVGRFEYRGYKTIGCDDDLPQIFSNGIKNAFIGVGFMGNSYLRNELHKKLIDIGFNIPAIIDPSASIASDAVIGYGTFVGKQAVINSNAKVGENVIINTGAIIEHDCSIGDFSHIAVGGILCGNVQVGKNCLIGAGAVILQGVCVADNAIVGAGSTVLKNVEADMFMYDEKIKITSKIRGGGV